MGVEIRGERGIRVPYPARSVHVSCGVRLARWATPCRRGQARMGDRDASLMSERFVFPLFCCVAVGPRRPAAVTAGSETPEHRQPGRKGGRGDGGGRSGVDVSLPRRQGVSDRVTAHRHVSFASVIARRLSPQRTEKPRWRRDDRRGRLRAGHPPNRGGLCPSRQKQGPSVPTTPSRGAVAAGSGSAVGRTGRPWTAGQSAYTLPHPPSEQKKRGLAIRRPGKAR